MPAPADRAGPDRRSRLLEGARAAFLRFGYERSSMADIAAEAGVSRTALYHYFPGKEEVLRAVVAELHAAALAAAQTALARSEGLEAALRGLLEAKLNLLLDAVGSSPHGPELVDAGHRLTAEGARAADAAFRALLAEALRRHGRGREAEEEAATLWAAAAGLMRACEDPLDRAALAGRVARLARWAAAGGADPATERSPTD